MRAAWRIGEGKGNAEFTAELCSISDTFLLTLSAPPAECALYFSRFTHVIEGS